MTETAQTESNLTNEVEDLRRQVRRLSRLLSATEASPVDLSIAQWCKRRGISKSKFYVLKAEGKAPALLTFDGVQRITPAADAAWETARLRDMTISISGE
jgi:hypothetical protein